MDRKRLIDALRGVYDPCCQDRGVSIVDMGVVEDVRHVGAHVEVDLIPTTGWCPFVANMSAAIPEALLALDGVETVDVQVVWEPAWTPDRLSESARAKLTMPLEELEHLAWARSDHRTREPLAAPTPPLRSRLARL
jgi:metal-sulfur cluster biosynthetic enzyme